MRARVLSTAALALMLPGLAPRGWAGEEPASGVDIRVVVVLASGRGTEASFGPGIPAEVRRKIQACRLAYTTYTLGSNVRKPTPFDREAAWPLPSKLELRVAASPQDSKTHPLSLTTRVLDHGKGRDEDKQVHKARWRVAYDTLFLIHLPRDPAALILSISAHRPRDR